MASARPIRKEPPNIIRDRVVAGDEALGGDVDDRGEPADQEGEEQQARLADRAVQRQLAGDARSSSARATIITQMLAATPWAWNCQGTLAQTAK